MRARNAYAARLRALAEDSGTLWLNDAADEIERLEGLARARQRRQARHAQPPGRAMRLQADSEPPAEPAH